ncbi:MAG: hypothetical protein NVS1B10_07930 [Candidatus Saccharimonadales bacterium]
MAELRLKHFEVSSLSLPTSTSELDVSLTNQPYYIKFNLQTDNARGESGTFLAAIASLNKQSITPTKYIDVRLNGRAYYQ